MTTGRTSSVEIRDDVVIKTVLERYHEHKIFENEIKWLKVFKDTNHFPVLLSFDSSLKEIRIKYAGVPISRFNMPEDTLDQLVEITRSLKENNCSHNDITESEILVKDGNITLCDFGWASNIGKLPYKMPKRLGRKYKNTGNFDDEYALSKIFEKLTGKKNEI